MFTSKLLLIKNEFLKLNNNDLILGTFISFRDLIFSSIPTLNFWYCLVKKNLSFLALDKFTVIIISYFSSLKIALTGFSILKLEENVNHINYLLNNSLDLVFGDNSLTNSDAIIILLRLILVGTIINIILTYLFRKTIRLKKKSVFYNDFLDEVEILNKNEKSNYEKDNFAISANKQININHLSQIILYLHKIRVIDKSALYNLLSNSELLSHIIGLKHLKTLELQDFILKNLDNLAKDKKLDINMKNLRESLILSSRNHPEKESLITSKLITEMFKIFPEFGQMLKTYSKLPENLPQLATNFHEFVNNKLQNIQNDYTKQDNTSNNKQILSKEIQYLYNKISQIYNYVQINFFGTKNQKNSEPNNQKTEDKLNDFINEISKTKISVDEVTNTINNVNLIKSKPDLEVNNNHGKSR